jgi:SAM-dependent methyltransferase
VQKSAQKITHHHMICKFCQSKEINRIKKITSPLTKHIYDLWKCNTCGSSFFNGSQYALDTSLLYDNLSENRQEYSVKFTENDTWLRQKKCIIQLLGHQPSSILDIGCRTGDFLLHFDNNTFRTGVELSGYYAKIGRNRGLEIILGNIEDISFTRKYEVVTCYAIIEHLSDPITLLDSLHDLVQHGGFLVIMLPSIETCKASSAGTDWHMYSPPEHLNFFSRQFLDRYLEERKFLKVKRYYSSGGMISYRGKKKIIIKSEAFVNKLVDHSVLNKLPLFDHMYSYYSRV